MTIREQEFHSAASAVPKVVTVAGSWNSPSKTRVLTDAIVASLQARQSINVTRIDLAEIGTEIAQLTDIGKADRNLLSIFSAVGDADLLIVGSPIYKAAYTGLFKHFFDLMDPRALVGKPVLLTATGGSTHYALVLEHHFRPLFSFFRAHTLPATVYAVEMDFENGALKNQDVKDRIENVAREALIAVARRQQSLTV